MHVSKYLNLKHKLKKLKSSVTTVNSQTRYNLLNNTITEITKSLAQLEETEDVKLYHEKIERKIDLQRRIGCWNYYKKDTSSLQEQLKILLEEIDDLTKDDESNEQEQTPQLPQCDQQTSPIIPVTDSPTPTYYIINLAWTFVTDSIQDPVIEFMKMSNHISIEETPNTITWKFPYDTIEERAQVKALQMCAAHLLEILKKMEKSDAEIFGKMQKY